MEVSKLSFEPKTLAALQNPTLSAKRKKQLRLKALEEWIEAHPYGTPLSGAELKRVGNFNTSMAAQAWLGRYVEKGKLVRHEVGPFSYFYQIPGKVTTRKLEPEKAAKEPEMDKFPTAAPQKSYTFGELEALAMKFDFYAGGNATVPAFLLYVQAVK